MASISSAADQARNNLQKIEHFVVLMLENRSFDQMLGHLELEGHEVDGVKRNEDKPLINWYNGDPYELRKATRTGLTTAEDPCHEGWCVADQLSTDYDENTGEPHQEWGLRLELCCHTSGRRPMGCNGILRCRAGTRLQLLGEPVLRSRSVVLLGAGRYLAEQTLCGSRHCSRQPRQRIAPALQLQLVPPPIRRGK